MAENEPRPRIIDNPGVAEIYVNRIIGSSFDGATIGVTLGCAPVVPERFEATPSDPVVYVAGRSL